VLVGYTGEATATERGSPAGARAVMSVAPVRNEGGLMVARVADTYDLTARYRVPPGQWLKDLNAFRRPVLAALGAVTAYNLIDTVRRHADRSKAVYGNVTRAAVGPLVVVRIEGGPESPHEGAYCVFETLPPAAIDTLNVPPDQVLLSFGHSGPVGFDRGLAPMVGMAPWAVVPGGVYNDEAIFGSVVVRQAGSEAVPPGGLI
jgi:hypothetical protein